MLEEDVDTVGFRPLHCEANRGIWYDGDKQRTTWHESQEIPRLAFKELLFRIRGILVTGLELAFDAVHFSSSCFLLSGIMLTAI